MKEKKNQKPREKGGLSRPASKPVLNHPDQPGEPPTSSGPDFGQSIEAGGMD